MKEFKYIGLWLLAVMPILFLGSCDDDDDYSGPIQIETSNLKNITYDSAECGGEIVIGSAKERGICWSTSPVPTIEDSKTLDGAGSGVFKSTLTGLSEGTTYYVRAWAKNGSGEVVYGEQKQCVTMAHGRPVVSINAINHIKEASVTIESQMLVDGGIEVSDYGIIYGSSPDLALDKGSIVKLAVSKNPIETKLNELTDNTVYYAVAYATYKSGTVYSDVASFKTVKYADPQSSLEVDNITGDGFDAKVTVKSGTPLPILEYGIVYGTKSRPTIEQNTIKKMGEGDGEATAEVDGLEGDTQYYVRPYAKNKNGVSYGEEAQVLTLSNKALVATIETSHITAHRAFVGGEILSLGLKGAPIKEAGICWSTKANPTIDNNCAKTDASEVGVFEAVQLFCLTPSTKYYARAYATNEYGTNYGEEFSFTTREPVANYLGVSAEGNYFNGLYMSATYPVEQSDDQKEAYSLLEKVLNTYGKRELKYFRLYVYPNTDGKPAYINSVAYYLNSSGSSYIAQWKTKLDMTDDYVYTCSHSAVNGGNATNLLNSATKNNQIDDLYRSVEFVTHDSFVVDWNTEDSQTTGDDAQFCVIPVRSPEKFKRMGAFRLTGTITPLTDWW